jgi:hypothetical protein
MFFIPKISIFKREVVLGVREGQPMHVMTRKSIDIDEKELLAPPVVRQVAPPATQLQREKVAP